MSRTAQQVLEQEFLQTRAKILELAAFFDRLQEASGEEMNAEQLKLLKQARDAYYLSQVKGKEVGKFASRSKEHALHHHKHSSSVGSDRGF